MRKARIALLEALIVAVVGLVLALGANALSPRGLRLTGNYFPGGAGPSSLAHSSANSDTALAKPGSKKPLEATTLQRLQQRGLNIIGSNLVEEMFRDTRYDQGSVVFIDARDDSHYQAGHIPGAWQFDHYHAEQYLPTILPICLNAQKAVIYCTGGSCEDSEFAAIMLRDAGVPRDKLFVYTGGITEWINSGRSVEVGSRQSGAIKSKP